MAAKRDFLKQNVKIGKSIVDVYGIYTSTNNPEHLILHGAVECTSDNLLNGKLAPGIDELYTEISVGLDWVKRVGGICTEMIPMFGPDSGPKGYRRWFTRNPEDAIFLSSDVGRQLRKSKRNDNKPWWTQPALSEQLKLLKAFENV